jgi:hypothetical protein
MILQDKNSAWRKIRQAQRKVKAEQPRLKESFSNRKRLKGTETLIFWSLCSARQEMKKTDSLRAPYLLLKLSSQKDTPEFHFDDLSPDKRFLDRNIMTTASRLHIRPPSDDKQ